VRGGITGYPVTEGRKYRDFVLQVGGRMQGRRPCCVKKNAKSKEMKTGLNLAESSMEYYGLESAVLPMMMMMISNSCTICRYTSKSFRTRTFIAHFDMFRSSLFFLDPDDTKVKSVRNNCG
jgi:hypothetical protein